MNRIAITISILLSTVLVGCSDDTSSMKVADIEQLIQNNELDRASIALKQKIQKQPDDITARLLLAQTQLNLGEYEGAEKEFLKILDVNKKDDFTGSFFSGYAEALYFTDNMVLLEKLSIEHKELTTKAIDVLVFTGLYQTDKLQEGSIAKLIATRNLEAALNEFDENTITQDNYYLGYRLVDLLFQEKKYQSALKLSELLIDIRRLDNRPVFYAMISSYKLGFFEKADKLASRILTSNQNNAIANLVKSAYSLEKSDFKEAKDYADLAIRGGLSNFDIRVIAGIANFQLDNFEQAYEHFSRIKKSLSKDSSVYHYVVATEIELGITDSSSFYLQNNDLGALLGLELVEQLEISGNENDADQLKQQISKIDIENEELNKVINMVLKSKGMSPYDTSDLKKILNTTSLQDRQLYISSFIAGGDTETAFATIEHWLSNDPDNIDLLLLKAAALLKVERIAEAKEIFLDILAIDRMHPQANTFLAFDKLKQEDYEGSIKDFQSVLSSQYSHNAVAGLIKASNLNNSLDDSLAWLIELYEKNSTSDSNLATDIAFIYFRKNQPSKALDFLSEVESQPTLPNRFYSLLSTIYASLGNNDAVENTISKWKVNSGLNDALISFSLRYYELQHKWELGISLIEEIEESSGKQLSPRLLASKAYFYTRANKISAAERILIDVPNVATNYYATKARGFIAATKSNWDQASESFKLVYEKSQSTENAVLLLKAYQALEDKRSVEQLANEHINKFPNDSSFKLRYAEWLFIKAPYDAITLYESMVKDNLVNINVLNNLSWLLQERGKLDEANNYINQAIKLDSSNINVVDTAITIKLKLSKSDEAVDLAADLYQSSDDNFSAGIIFVKTLIDTGDKSSAAAVLSKLKPRNSKESSIKTSFERTLKSS
jgi:tetratricopeptide (TPR) repeat protein